MTIKLVQFYDNPKTYPRNLHTPKLFIFLKTPKNIEIQKFEPQNMVRAYVYMKISVFPSLHSWGDPSANIFDVTTRKFFRMENLSIFIDDNNTKTIKVAHNHCFCETCVVWGAGLTWLSFRVFPLIPGRRRTESKTKYHQKQTQ